MLRRFRFLGLLARRRGGALVAAPFLVAVLILAAGCSGDAPMAPTAPASVAASVEGYRLGPGDHLHITVFGDKDLTGDYVVDGNGMMAFPLIGQVRAGGLTGKGLQQAIVGRLSPNYIRNPSVSVEVLKYRPFYIVGEVKNPGSYPYVTGMTVINGVALAGGFTYRAREGSFDLMRTEPDGRKEKYDANPQTPVEPGDVITVRERYF